MKKLSRETLVGLLFIGFIASTLASGISYDYKLEGLSTSLGILAALFFYICICASDATDETADDDNDTVPDLPLTETATVGSLTAYLSAFDSTDVVRFIDTDNGITANLIKVRRALVTNTDADSGEEEAVVIFIR